MAVGAGALESAGISWDADSGTLRNSKGVPVSFAQADALVAAPAARKAIAVNTYTTALLTAGEEMARARAELTGGGPCDYVILRVAESSGKYGNVNRAGELRQLVEGLAGIDRARHIGAPDDSP